MLCLDQHTTARSRVSRFFCGCGEKSTSIYSGMLRLLDLASSLGDKKYDFFLVAPDSLQKEIVAQLKRPAFSTLGNVAFRYLLFSDISCNCEATSRFGDDYRVLLKVARC